jgi:DNA-binding MarR family transcriptional regulator
MSRLEIWNVVVPRSWLDRAGTLVNSHFDLRSLSRLVTRLYDAHLVSSGLRSTQYTLLAQAALTGPLRPTDLARTIGIDASTLTRNAGLMIAAGWLAQGEGTDRRRRLISITAAGRLKLAEAGPLWNEAQRSLRERLGSERTTALHALLGESYRLLVQEARRDAGPEAEAAAVALRRARNYPCAN